MSNWRTNFRQRLPWLLGVSGIIVCLDQVTKWWVYNNLGRRESISVISGFFDIVHVHNTGAAFGFFSGWQQGLTVLSITAILGFLVYFFYMPSGSRLILFALAMVIAGAVGNVMDRLQWGFVVDFIDWHYKEVYHWPAFNIADSSISIALFLLIIEFSRDFFQSKIPQEEVS